MYYDSNLYAKGFFSALPVEQDVKTAPKYPYFQTDALFECVCQN